MANSYISTVFINNQTYYLKDSEARTMLSNVYTKAETDTAIAEAIGEITGISFEVVQTLPATGEAGVIYLMSNGGTSPNIYDEYVWIPASSTYEKIGTTDVDLSGYAKTEDLGDLAYKDSASGSFTPHGSVTVNAYTPEGSVSVGKITPSGSVSINAFTPSGSISTGTGTANYTPAGNITVNSYTPEGTIAMDNYTPAGSITMDNYTPAGSISTGTGTANYTPAGSVTVNAYTPEGSVSAPTITVTPSTTTVNSITAVGTLPTWSAAVNNEVLSFSWSQGTLPTKGSNTTVMTGASAESSQPEFTGTAKAPTGSFSGTGVELKFTGTAKKPTGSFSGTAAAPTGSFEGTAKAPTGSFSGTGVQLKFTGTQVTPTGSFSGTEVTPTASFTGTAKAPTGSFSGTTETVTVS